MIIISYVTGILYWDKDFAIDLNLCKKYNDERL